MQYLIGLVTFCSRPESSSDVISSLTVDQVGLDVPVKLGDSRSHCSRDIRVPHFVMDDDERTNPE